MTMDNRLQMDRKAWTEGYLAGLGEWAKMARASVIFHDKKTQEIEQWTGEPRPPRAAEILRGRALNPYPATSREAWSYAAGKIEGEAMREHLNQAPRLEGPEPPEPEHAA